MPLTVQLNGESRELTTLTAGASLAAVIGELGLKPDRIAVERNGEIAPRRAWESTPVAPGDKLEVVHFVGGGTAPALPVVNCT